MTNRLQILERERQRLERQLARNPQWRAMSAAGGVPQRVAGEWQFPGLNRVQANALRQSLLFGAYQEVLAGIEALHGGSEGHAGSAGAQVAVTPGGDDGGAKPKQRELPGQHKGDGAQVGGAGASPVLQPAPEPTPEPAPQPASQSAPAAAFRTRVKIKPDSSILITDNAAPTAPVRPADDLTHIRRIDRALAKRLEAAGVTSFAEIAAWSSGEVRRMARELELDKRIWRENWIEQAAVLAMRADAAVAAATAEAARVAAEMMAEAATPAERPVEEPTLPSPVAVVATGAEEAVPVESVEVVEPNPAVANVAVDEPASAPVPVVALPQILVKSDADARTTAPPQTADPLPAGDAAALEGDRKPAPELVPEQGRERALEPVSELAPEPAPAPVTWGEPYRVGRRAKRLPAPSLRRLTYIRGLSDKFADELVAAGIRSIAEIAQWSAADVRWFRAVLGEGARISADQWIEQAQILAGGHWTRYALRLVNGDFSSLVAERSRPVRERQARSPAPVGRPVEGATIPDAIAQGAEARFDRAPPAPTKHAGDAVRRTPPPLPQIKPRTVIAAPVAIEPIDVILRGLIRKGEPAPTAGEAAPSSGVEAQRGPGAADTSERWTADDRPTGDDAPTQVALKVSSPAASAVVVPAASPVVAPTEPGTEEPGPAATGARPEAPADDRTIVAEADAAPPLRVPAPVTVSAAAVREAETSEPVEPSAEPLQETVSRPARIEAAEDIEDAEVLIVTRKPAATDEAVSVPDALEAAIEAGSGAYGGGEDGFGDEFRPPGDEAAVRIVARQRASAAAEKTPAAAAGRERLGYSPEFIARRLGARDEDDGADGEAYAGYHDDVEEATVTIIRARASEELVSSVMPERAANDQPLAEDAPAEAKPARKKGAFGSRFLRALTGE